MERDVGAEPANRTPPPDSLWFSLRFLCVLCVSALKKHFHSYIIPACSLTFISIPRLARVLTRLLPP